MNREKFAIMQKVDVMLEFQFDPQDNGKVKKNENAFCSQNRERERDR